MNATARKNYRTALYNTNITKPAIISGILHVGVFLLALYGVPFITKDYEPEDIIIPVEVFDPSEIVETVEPEEPEKLVEPEPAPPPKRKPVYNNNDSVPDLSVPDDPVPEEKPEPPEPKEVIPDPMEIKTPPKPKSKPKPPKRPEPPVKKPEPQPKEEKPERDINSLLKSLTPDEPEEQIKPTEKTAEGNASSEGDVNRQMTSSDLVALVQGVQPCWNVNAGGRYAENLVVRLRVKVNRDRTVSSVEILDNMRYATDSHFKSAADAARWALLDQKCTRLNLPEDKYETWKSFIFVFDPSQML